MEADQHTVLGAHAHLPLDVLQPDSEKHTGQFRCGHSCQSDRCSVRTSKGTSRLQRCRSHSQPWPTVLLT